MKNLLRQQYSIKKVYEMVENSGLQYDGYLFLRPDMIYLTPLNIKSLLPLKNNQLCIPRAFSYSGYNDRICFACKETSKIYASRIDSIYKEDNVHSETFLKKHILNHSINVLPLKLFALRVRANGQIVIG
jgi:hypothetical protein